MGRVLAAVLALALVAGCGGGESAGDVLSQTSERLGEIRSGQIAMSLRMSGADGDQAGAVGFELRGPFSLDGPGSFPVARLDYTQTAGAESATVTLVLTGRSAFVEIDGQAYELPDEQARPLRAALEGVTDAGGGGLAIGDWSIDPALSDGGEVGGVPTDRVRARLDVLSALDGLRRLALGAGAGESLPAVGEDEAALLERATRRATLDLRTGADDRLLRRLAIDLDFAAEPPVALRPALGPLVGLQVDLRVAIDRPNEPVEVEAPADPLPSSALPAPPA